MVTDGWSRCGGLRMDGVGVGGYGWMEKVRWESGVRLRIFKSSLRVCCVGRGVVMRSE